MSNLLHIYFTFNQSNSLYNLTQLQQLTLGEYFDQPLKNLLENLTQLQELTLGYKFTQEFNIHYSVKILKLNCNNRKIINYLPNSIDELYLGSNFDLELNDLPSSIKILSFDIDSNYDKELNNLPKFI